jgi:hypothetical protein
MLAAALLVLMRKSFAKDCGEVKWSILQRLRVSRFPVRIRRSNGAENILSCALSKELNFRKDVVADILSGAEHSSRKQGQLEGIETLSDLRSQHSRSIMGAGQIVRHYSVWSSLAVKCGVGLLN